MELLKVESPLNANPRQLSSEIQLELLKLHQPPPKSPPPEIKPVRRWVWLLRNVGAIFALFSVRGSMNLHREVGPEFRPERVERKEGRPRFY